MILLTGFSRNYLGIHTPQGVLVGLMETVLVLWDISAVLKVTEKHPEKEKWIFLAGILIGFPRLLYTSLKSYPVIENVDPEKMKRDGYGDIGR